MTNATLLIIFLIEDMNVSFLSKIDSGLIFLYVSIILSIFLFFYSRRKLISNDEIISLLASFLGVMVTFSAIISTTQNFSKIKECLTNNNIYPYYIPIVLLIFILIPMQKIISILFEHKIDIDDDLKIEIKNFCDDNNSNANRLVNNLIEEYLKSKSQN